MTQFEKIYRAYFSDVYLYLKSLCRDDDLAEELCSEAFFRAMKSFDKFRGDCEVRVWLCQIGKNCYYSHLRKQGREVPEEEAERPDAGFEQDVLDKSDAMRLHLLLHDLPEPYKEVFTLRVLGELSFKQIGEIFGKSDNWACVTYHRARKTLREKMEESKHEK